MINHDPYWPIVQKRAVSGQWLVYNWNTDRWEIDIGLLIRSRFTYNNNVDDIEPGTDWTTTRSL